MESDRNVQSEKKERWRKEVQQEGLKMKGLLRKLAKMKRCEEDLDFHATANRATVLAVFKTVRRQSLLKL